LPQHVIPVALLFFNIGVEIGQLLFVAVVLSLMWGLRNLPSRRPASVMFAWTFYLPDATVAYGIGIVAAYWLIERTIAFFVQS
jgi:hypothetical protein